MYHIEYYCAVGFLSLVLLGHLGVSVTSLFSFSQTLIFETS